MRLLCSPFPNCSRRVVSTLPENLTYDVDYHFSNSFIARHRQQLLQWNTSLVKAQGHRDQLARKNRVKTDQYLSKLRSVLCDQRRSIVPIGSSVNGLCGKNSDLDLNALSHCECLVSEGNHDLAELEYFKLILEWNSKVSCYSTQCLKKLLQHGANIWDEKAVRSMLISKDLIWRDDLILRDAIRAARSALRYGFFLGTIMVLITDDKESKRVEYCQKFKNNEQFRRNQMNAVAGMLKSAKLVEPKSFQHILFSVVPILKFTSREGVTVDLQFNNIGPIRSSLFVRACVQFSIVVPIVLHWISSFFETIKLKNSRHGLFSTYHLNMLALHFLQNRTFRVLPEMLSSCPLLQPNTPWQEVAEVLSSRDAELRVLSTDFISPDVPPAEVIIKMIDYFSQIDLHAVSIDICGGVYRRMSETTEDSFIQLIDPYFFGEVSPHARCIVRNGPSLVQQAFSAVKSDLKSGIASKFLRIDRL